MRFEEIILSDINELAKMYVDTFNVPPWNDECKIRFVAQEDNAIKNKSMRGKLYVE